MSEELDYITEAFTKTGDNVNLEVDNLNVGCITSKNNNFELDSEGNLTVKSITTQAGSTSGMIQIEVRDFIYPVGSIYMSVSSISPNILFGGNWEQIKGRFLLGCGDNGDGLGYAPNSVGGSARHRHTIGIGSTDDGYLTFDMHLLANGEIIDTSQMSNWGGKLTPTYGIGIQDYDIKRSYTSIADYNESLPPYLAVYIWTRVS